MPMENLAELRSRIETLEKEVKELKDKVYWTEIPCDEKNNPSVTNAGSTFVTFVCSSGHKIEMNDQS